ncbi:MAG: hypothetical protein MJ213_04460 [Bacilli bacterium]|nr:hypothetical protein [Bacilli bacterium]
MKKAICDKCNSLITIDESAPVTNCPHCKAQIFSDTVIKNYMRVLSNYRRRADIAFTNQADYQTAYKNYRSYYNLLDDNLAALVAVSIARIRCSTIHKITIKEAIDFLMDGSDKVEITSENVSTLSESFTKMKNDAKLIVDTFNEVKDLSNYSLNMYHDALEQYKYFLNKYLEIYQALNQFNKYLADNDVSLKEEIDNVDKLLKAKISVKDQNDKAHDFYNYKKQKVVEIFPAKKTFFRIHIALYIATGLGAVMSIIGLIFLSTLKDSNPAATFSVLVIGLLLFFGGYFVNHYITRKNKEKSS